MKLVIKDLSTSEVLEELHISEGAGKDTARNAVESYLETLTYGQYEIHSLTFHATVQDSENETGEQPRKEYGGFFEAYVKKLTRKGKKKRPTEAYDE